MALITDPDSLNNMRVLIRMTELRLKPHTRYLSSFQYCHGPVNPRGNFHSRYHEHQTDMRVRLEI